MLGAVLVGDASPGSTRQRRLLTILAVAAFEGRALGSDELLDALYGDHGAANARRALATEVWRARQLLGTEGLLAGPDGYLIDTGVVSIDVLDFRTDLARGREALHRGDFAEAAVHLDSALARWRGTPLTDWSDGRRARAVAITLEELRLGCTEDLAEALCGLERYDEAARLVQGVIETAPQREHSWALLAECHLAMGDRRRARIAFDSARRALAEYGVEPGAELSAVRELIAGSMPEQQLVRQSSGLIGRDGILTQLSTTIDEALARARTTVVVISGEAGVGKSSVVDQVADVVSAGPTARRVRVARAHCDRRLTRPFAALDHLLTEFGAPAAQANVDASADPHDGQGLATAVAGVLENAAAEGLLLVVEDAHWATVETLEVLELLALRSAAVPLTVLVTVREPAVVGPGVQAGLADLRRRARLSVSLAGLSEEDTGRLLGLDPSRAQEVHRLTRGNPLFLRSLTVLDEGGVSVAGSLDDALDEHIDSLPAEALPVLEVAAVIGQAFDLRVLTSAVAQHRSPIDPLTVGEALAAAGQAGLLNTRRSDEPQKLTFAHALVRDRLYARTPPRARAEAHALVARALQRRPEVVAPDLLAHHSLLGWPTYPTGDVVRALRAAGDAAYRELGFREALKHYDDAHDVMLMDPGFDDPEETRGLLAAAGQAATASDDLVRGRLVYTALRANGLEHDDPTAVITGSLGLLRTYFDERVDPEAVTGLSADLLALFEREDEFLAVPDALVVDALSTLHLYQPATAQRLRDRLAGRSPGLHARLLERTWAYERVAAGLEVARELSTAPAADPLGAALRLWASEVGAGRRTLHEARDTWTLPGGPEAQWESRLWRTMGLMVTGEFDRARRLLLAADVEVTQARGLIEHTLRASQVLGQRQFLALQSGDLETLIKVAGVLRPSLGTFRPTNRFAGALQRVLLGDRDGAWTQCDQLHDEFRAGLVPAQDLHGTLTGYIQACGTLEHAPGLALARDLLLPYAGEHVVLYLTQYWGSVNHQIGKVSAFFDDLDVAEEHLRTGLEEHRHVGAPVYEVHSLRNLAPVLWHRGKRAEADRMHEEYKAVATRLGMHSVAARPWPPVRAWAGA